LQSEKVLAQLKAMNGHATHNVFKRQQGSIHHWCTQKRKKDSKTFVELLSTNNIFMKQFLVKKN
jgi:hypothetical protein